MKLLIKVSEDDNGFATHKICVDGLCLDTICSLVECPEDAIIGRSLLSGEDIEKYIWLGYEVGKRGDTIEVEYRDVKDE
jgi:hypothetical protein